MTEAPDLPALDPSRIAVVLFDYDDTLVRTRECRWEAIREAGRRGCGWAPSLDEIERFWGLPYRTFFEKVFDGRAPDLDAVIHAYESLNDLYPTMAHEGALEVLARIAKERRVGIVTAGARGVVLDQLRRLGVDPSGLDWLQTVEDSEHHKPDPRVFEKAIAACAACEIPASAMLYVGDAFTDYLAAREAGLAFVGIPRVEVQRARMYEAAVPCVDTLVTLADWLDDRAVR